MAKLGPDVITEEINIDDEDSSTDPDAAAETCVSVQCQKQIKGGTLGLIIEYIFDNAFSTLVAHWNYMRTLKNTDAWVYLEKKSDLNVLGVVAWLKIMLGYNVCLYASLSRLGLGTFESIVLTDSQLVCKLEYGLCVKIFLMKWKWKKERMKIYLANPSWLSGSLLESLGKIPPQIA